jgi:death-on-curing protein
VYKRQSLKVAALLHSLARSHVLVDGNKRLAWLATVVFLDLNGYEADLTDDEAFDLVMNVAEGLLELNAIVHRLSTRKHGDG